MLANILYILAAVLPPCGAWAWQQWVYRDVHRESNRGTTERTRLNYAHDKQKGMNEEQTAALLANHAATEALTLRVKQLEALCEEQQLTLNRIADRY